MSEAVLGRCQLLWNTVTICPSGSVRLRILTYSSHRCGENKRRPDPRAHRLAQHDLVIFVRDARHHEPDYMHERADENRHARSVAVK